jgi:hypothetical protein
MKTNILKQIAIVVICALGLYFSGLNLVIMSGVTSLIDGLNVMVFFTCFFPFLIVLLRLSSKVFNSFVHSIAHSDSK